MSATHQNDHQHHDIHADEPAGHDVHVGGEGHDEHTHGHDETHSGADAHGHDGHDEHHHPTGGVHAGGAEEHASEQGTGGPHHH